MSHAQNIQWFPGHMAKTRRKIGESLSLVDAVAEIVDARIPASSRNPELAGILAGKPALILLNKADLADPAATAAWMQKYKAEKVLPLQVDCKTGRGLREFRPAVRQLLADRLEQYRKKGMEGKPLRVMVVGIPNVGKSSFINRLAGGSRAKVEDRPGVTRGNQWFKVADDLELLDTPGVLWPKFDDPAVGERLAFTGAIKDQVVDTETLAAALLAYLGRQYASLLQGRYGFSPADIPLEEDDMLLTEDTGGTDGKEIRWGYAMLTAIGERRRMFISGGEVDTARAAAILLDEFRSGKLGRISLEWPEG